MNEDGIAKGLKKLEVAMGLAIKTAKRVKSKLERHLRKKESEGETPKKEEKKPEEHSVAMGLPNQKRSKLPILKQNHHSKQKTHPQPTAIPKFLLPLSIFTLLNLSIRFINNVLRYLQIFKPNQAIFSVGLRAYIPRGMFVHPPHREQSVPAMQKIAGYPHQNLPQCILP